MNLSDQHKLFLMRDQGLVPAFFNIVINGLICWLMFRSVLVLSVWGEGSIAIDLLATALLLPLITCLIVSPLVSKQIRSGKMDALNASHIATAGLARKGLLMRALAIGVFGVFFGALPIVTAVSLTDAGGIAASDYIIFKALWCGMLAMLASPVIAWWAMQNASASMPAQ